MNQLESDRPTNRRWVMFSLAAGTSFILYLHRYTWNLIRPELKQEYNLSNTELETLSALFNISYAVFQVPAGVLCDLIGPHLFLGAIIAAWSLMLPLLGMGSSMTAIGAARFGFGAAQAGCYPALAKLTRVWLPPHNRTSLQGWIASFFGRGGGAVASVAMGGTLWLLAKAGLGWRTALILFSLVGAIFSAVFFRLARNSPEDDPRTNDAERDLIRGGPELVDVTEQPRILPLRRALRNPSLIVFSFQQYMNAGADYVYSGLMGSYFVEARHVQDKAILGLLVSLPIWGGAFGGVVGGLLNDFLIRVTGSRRWSRSLVGFSGKMFACVFLYLSITHPDPMVGAWLLLVTKFFTDWTQPTVWGTSTDLGGRYSATVFSIINAMGSLGAAMTPLLFGWLLDKYSTLINVDGAMIKQTNFTPVFAVVGMMYILSAISWLFINCTNSLDREGANGPA
jgi:MFS transporter, ACS family, glucarate transporter